ATADTAITGPSAATISTADRRRRRPRRRITALTGSDQTLAPRPSHSAARKMFDWRRLPLDDRILRLLPDLPLTLPLPPLLPWGPPFASGAFGSGEAPLSSGGLTARAPPSGRGPSPTAAPPAPAPRPAARTRPSSAPAAPRGRRWPGSPAPASRGARAR